jgi:hypothetical protein
MSYDYKSQLIEIFSKMVGNGDWITILNYTIVQNYWGFGLLPSSGILGTRKHDVSETDPASETSCFLVPTIPGDGKVQKHSNSECDTPSSEPFGLYMIVAYFKAISYNSHGESYK